MSKNTRYRVLADYEVNDPHPLILPADATVKGVRTDNGWPGWLWAESDGNSGWIAFSYLEKMPDGSYRTTRDYNGTELSARKNDILTAMESESGWVIVRSENGETGWFPLFNLRLYPQT